MKYEKLTGCEEILMRAVWDCEKEPTRSELMKCVAKYPVQWKEQTVSTFLAKLIRKNYLNMKRNGKTCVYTVLITKEEYRRDRMNQLFQCLYHSDRSALRQDVEAI